MAIDKKITIGVLIVILLTSGIVYVVFQGEGLKFRCDYDKCTFYVFNNDSNRWEVSGREYNRLFDGASRMNRRSSEITIDTIIGENNVTIKRTTPYIRGPVIVDTYYFEGNITDKKLFPIYHKVEIYNGSGFFYRYEVRDLEYEGETIKLNVNYMKFGKNMIVSWQGDYRWAWVYKTGILKVQYDISTDYEVFNVRLFDPKENYLKKIETVVDLTWAYTEYEICNPTEMKYLEGMALGWRGENIEDVNYVVQELEKYQENITTRIYSIKKDCKIVIDNKTFEEIEQCWNVTYVSGFEYNLEDRTRWVDWDGKLDSKISLENPTCKRVRVYGTYPAKLGKRKIEHVPTVFGYEYKEFDWWNLSWGYVTPIRIEQTGSTTLTNMIINVTYNLSGLITNGTLDDEGKCLRFVNYTNATNTLDFVWGNYSDATYGLNGTSGTQMYVIVDSLPTTNTTIHMFYDEACAGTGFGNTTLSDFAPTGGSVWLMDEGAGTVAYDATGNGHDMSFVGDPTWASSPNSVYGYAVDFDGAGDYMCAATSPISSGSLTDVSFGLWFNTSTGTTNDRLFEYLYIDTDAAEIAIYTSELGGGKIKGYIYEGSSYKAHSPGAHNDGVWYFVVTTYDGSTVILYMDGEQVSNTSVSTTMNFTSFDELCIAGQSGKDTDMLGDFAFLLNRTLSADEVRRLYQQDLIIFGTEESAPVVGDTTDPVVTLNSPADTSTDTDGSVTFNCTAYDNINVTNVTLYHNATETWHANETNSSGINNTDYIFTKTLGDGNYIWNCYACDNSSNCVFAAANYSLVVDATVPTSNSPSDATYEAHTTNNISWILQDNIAVGHYYIKRNGTLQNSSNDWVNNTALDVWVNTTLVGSWNYTVFFNDSAGNNGVTDEVIIAIQDTTVPTSSSPADDSHAQDSTQIIAWTLQDNYATGYYYVLRNGTTQNSSTAWANNTALDVWVNTTETGSWNYTIFYNDSIGNDGTHDEVLITIIDETAPTSNSPSDATHEAPNASAIIAWILQDRNAVGKYNVTRNGTLQNTSVAWTNNTALNIWVNTTAIGSWNYTIFYNDLAGNDGTTDEVIIAVQDTVAPTSNSPSDASYAIGTTQTIGWVLQDAFQVGHYWVERNGTTQNGTTAWTNNTALDIWVNTTALGSWNYTIFFNDSIDNDGATDEVLITITIGDIILPTITIQLPFNITYGNNTIWFNITADETLNWSAVDISGTNHTLTNSSGNWNYLNDTLSDGTYEAVFWANDTTGNMNTTSIIFSIDDTLPTITILSPTNATYIVTIIDLNWSVDEDIDWAAYSLNGGSNTTIYGLFTNDTEAPGGYCSGSTLEAGPCELSMDEDWSTRIMEGGDTPLKMVFVHENMSYHEGMSNLTWKMKTLEGVGNNISLYCWNSTSWSRIDGVGGNPLVPDALSNTTMVLNGSTNCSYSRGYAELRTVLFAYNPCYYYEGALYGTQTLNTTITAQDGQNNVTVWANDTVGNINYSTVYFAYDVMNVNLTTNDFVLNFSTGSITFNYSSWEVNWTNAQPENQTSTVGIYNATWLGSTVSYPIGLNASLNFSNSCVNVYFSNNSFINNSNLITNTSNTTVFYNISSIVPQPIWAWINLTECTVGTSLNWIIYWDWYYA